MNASGLLTDKSRDSVLTWAVQKRVLLTVSVYRDEDWHSLRSFPINLDLEHGLLQITYPAPADHRPMPEITVGEAIGVSFRRGHKKCIFMTNVVIRRADRLEGGEATDTLIVKLPVQMREMQRRLYQRVTIPPRRFLAVKLWEGGLPMAGEPAIPICAGHVSNISAGGILVDIRIDQNPRLGMGDLVGVELTVQPGQPPLAAEAQYRHCVLTTPERLGLGLQFVGLEREEPGRATLGQMAELIRMLRREGAVLLDDPSES